MNKVATKKRNSTALVKAKVSLPKKAAKGLRAVASVDPEALIARAIDKGMPVESMERLLAMRREMKAEWARDQFFTALTGFQHECPAVEKTHEVPNRDKKTVRYRYAALEDIVEVVRPFLEKWGFSWTVKPQQTDGHVKASVYAHHKDGHEEVTEFEVPLDPEAYMSDPQRAAAALTFARRYAFINAFGIVTKGEDNDAQDDELPRRREPIRQPQERKPADVIPVAHEEVRSDYDKILHYIKATEVDPKTKLTVALFSENERLDYTHEANEAKGKPEELKKILDDIIATGKKRRAAVKGD